MNNIIRDILTDLEALKSRYNLSIIKAIISNRGFHALLFYRIANYLHKRRIPLIPLILTRIIQIVYGIDIDYRAHIESGVIIIHGVGTVIGSGVKIKKGCIIYHQVTLGIKMSGHNDGFPEIGENVILGAGCKVLGKVKVGDNSVIGANTVVTFNVPENRLVKFSEKAFIQITIKD